LDYLVQGSGYVVRSREAVGVIAEKLDQVITEMDGEVYVGGEGGLGMFGVVASAFVFSFKELFWRGSVAVGGADGEHGTRARLMFLVGISETDPALRGGWGSATRDALATTAMSSVRTTNYFAKVNLYANSKLPMNLPPLKL
jgi:hypothetical protein